MAIDIHVAEQFGNAIVNANFAGAHALLTEEAKQKYTPDVMKQAVTTMIEYAQEPLKRVSIISGGVEEEWPDKQYGDP